ncbi:hypothetical protein LCGC14_2164640 [marine sediment metagenome]|uniref:Uncharacterized protein n=1 Tax=marine sediment metagenome TaxID=412755 RepID=A0A0F9GMX2_9ZZZZ
METWTETYHCESRSHCDFCLDGKRWYKLLSDRFVMPKQGTCPFGETLAAAKARRVDVLVSRVKNGSVSLEEALVTAESLGMDLERAPDEPANET